MYIGIAAMVLFPVGVVGAVWATKRYITILRFITVFVSVIAAIALILLFCAAVTAPASRRQDAMERQTLQAIVDSSDNVASAASEIISFNRRVDIYQRMHNSPWVGWYFYDGCEDLRPIDIT